MSDLGPRLGGLPVNSLCTFLDLYKFVRGAARTVAAHCWDLPVPRQHSRQLRASNSVNLQSVTGRFNSSLGSHTRRFRLAHKTMLRHTAQQLGARMAPELSNTAQAGTAGAFRGAA